MPKIIDLDSKDLVRTQRFAVDMAGREVSSSSFPLRLSQWSSAQVADEMSRIGTSYMEYKQAILDNAIDGGTLFTLLECNKTADLFSAIALSNIIHQTVFIQHFREIVDSEQQTTVAWASASASADPIIIIDVSNDIVQLNHPTDQPQINKIVSPVPLNDLIPSNVPPPLRVIEPHSSGRTIVYEKGEEIKMTKCCCIILQMGLPTLSSSWSIMSIIVNFFKIIYIFICILTNNLPLLIIFFLFAVPYRMYVIFFDSSSSVHRITFDDHDKIVEIYSSVDKLKLDNCSCFYSSQYRESLTNTCTIEYLQIGNVGYRHNGMTINDSKYMNIYIILKNGTLIDLQEGHLEDDIDRNILAWHYFLFGRNDPASYVAPLPSSLMFSGSIEAMV